MKAIGIKALPAKDQPEKKALRGRRMWIPALILILLAVAGAGAYWYFTQNNGQAQAASELQTATAYRGDITLMASGSGTIVPASEITIGFQESGTLSEVLVSAGDKVQAGQVLARLQTNNTEETIAASVAQAELAVLTAQQSLDKLNSSAATERATAMQEVATYAATVKDAQYQLDNYTISSGQEDMTAMEAMQATSEKLDQARAAFEPYKYVSSGNSTRQALKAQLDAAQGDYNSAIKRLEYEYELEVAKANLANAMQTYDSLKDGPAADDLAIAQAELANAQAQLASAKEEQVVVELAAPVDGTILSLDASVGESVGSSAFITLADLSQPLLKVNLDEADMNQVKAGYEAEVVFDALPDSTFTGTVVSVNPSLVTAYNVSTVEAMVQLTGDGLDEVQALPVGTSASVDVISGQAKNSVLVPVEALRQIDTGEYAVFVMEDGEPTLRTVTVGLQDVTYAEITSGLDAGEVVTTGVVQTSSGQTQRTGSSSQGQALPGAGGQIEFPAPGGLP